MTLPTTHPVFPNMTPTQVGTGDTAFNLMQVGTGWNIVYKFSWSDEQWGTWWHTAHDEAEARAEFVALASDPFFSRNRYLRLIDAEGNIVGRHKRGDTNPPRYAA
jgi:hypothetical protein